MNIDLGRTESDPIGFDLDILLRSHLLVTCNSGGGKSWVLRRIAEQFARAKLQTIIIDPEGEFASLRECFPFALVAKEGGDTLADPRTAALLAHELLKLGLSAVCDLYELKADARVAWIASFLDAMVDAPKDLWRDCAVLLDEAQIAAPEGKESAASSSVSAMATRGRKRGYMLGCFTQRLSDFRKQVAAQCQNVLVGPTFMDLDLERSADALSIQRRDRQAFFAEAKTLDPGNFWALGRAISKTRALLKVGPVTSTHPEPGQRRRTTAPPPPEQIRRVLLKLSDLPKEVEKKERTEADLRGEIADLRRQLAAAAAAPPPPPKEKVVTAIPVKQPELVAKIANAASQIAQALEWLQRDGKGLVASVSELETLTSRAQGGAVTETRSASPVTVTRSASAPRGDTNGVASERTDDANDGAARALRALAGAPDGRLTKRQVASLAALPLRKSTFRNVINKLAKPGHIEVTSDMVSITPEGRRAAGDVRVAVSAADVVAIWRSRFTGKARDLLDIFTREHGPFTKQELADRLGLDLAVSTFRNAFGQLKVNDIVRAAPPRGFAVVEELAL